MKSNKTSFHKILIIKALMFFLVAFAGLQFGQAQTLSELNQIAANKNLELKAQYKRFEAQLERVNQAKAWQDPNLSFGYFISPIETRVGPQIARFSLTQMLPWFGTYKTKGNISAYRAEAEFQNFQDKKMKLFLEVARQYYSLTALAYQTDLERKQLSNLEDIKVTVQVNYENNKADLIDIYRIDLDIDKQKNTLKILEHQKVSHIAKLNLLLNRDSSAAIIIDNPQQLLEAMELVSLDSISMQHPRLKRLESLKASAHANTVLANKQNKPQFGIGLDYAIIQDRNVQNANAGQDAIMPMLSMSLPIFGQKNKSRKKVAALEEDAVEIEFENEVLTINNEYEIATYERKELLEILNLYNRQLEDLNDMIGLSEASLANAKMSVEAILDLQNERLLIEKQRVKTLAELQKNLHYIKYFTQNTE